LHLPARDVAALEARTEGWVTGLQLAALSVQGRDDIGGFISTFTGDDRYIIDYLVEEVLQRQSEDVRSFLLQTSILHRLSGPLCNAVTGRESGQAMLETLERANLFVVPLDDKRRWYRYHQLFADVLIRARPVLSTYYAFALLGMGEMDAAAVRLNEAERWLDESRGEPASGVDHSVATRDRAGASRLTMVVADRAEFRSLPGTIALARSFQAQALGDVAGTLEH